MDCGLADRLLFRAQPGLRPGLRADVAQLVEHHLAKVRVAGSSPVVRSEAVTPHRFTVRSNGLAGLEHGGVAERRGNGLQSRVHGFESRLHLESPCGSNGRLAQW